jgi:AAA+ superfamily predicted ATPase
MVRRAEAPLQLRAIPRAQLSALQRDRWVSYPAGDAGLERLGEMLETPARVRMPCLLLYGMSGTGKSMLLEKFQRDIAKKVGRPTGRRLIVAAQMPPVPLIRSLYAEIVRALDGGARSAGRFHELEGAAVGLLKHASPRMLIIDEIQHLLSCNAREQRAALNAIKYLANTLRMSIVAAGTHEAVHVMRYDPQIASRFEQMELPVWGETEELRRFAAGYVTLLPSRLGADLDQRVIAYLLELTDGITGRVTDVLRRAAAHAIATRSHRITLDTLQYVGAHLPVIINQRA